MTTRRIDRSGQKAKVLAVRESTARSAVQVGRLQLQRMTEFWAIYAEKTVLLHLWAEEDSLVRPVRTVDGSLGRIA